MSKRIQCEKCSAAEYGESLWIYRGKQYCSICACDEMSNRGEDIGIGDFCNDTTRKHKQKDQRIAELKQKLENAIVPKFRVGQEVWVVWTEGVLKNRIHKFTVDGYARNNWQGENNKGKDSELLIYFNADNRPIAEQQQYCFATEQEARKALDKLKNN